MARLHNVEGIPDVPLFEDGCPGLVLHKCEELGDAVQLLLVQGCQDGHLLEDLHQPDLGDVAQERVAVIPAEGVAHQVGHRGDRSTADLALVEDGPLAEGHAVDEHGNLANSVDLHLRCSVLDEVQHISLVAFPEDYLSSLELHPLQGFHQQVSLVHIQVLHHLHAADQFHPGVILCQLVLALDLVEHLAVKNPELHVCAGLDGCRPRCAIEQRQLAKPGGRVQGQLQGLRLEGGFREGALALVQHIELFAVLGPLLYDGFPSANVTERHVLNHLCQKVLSEVSEEHVRRNSLDNFVDVLYAFVDRP
mmetsp:Transcript_39224/g.111042  ORF Transcript_39224/g.111042 Transcript_39224/m.111042 type:complete len:307 (-) Transcript_39224:1211-2131(-)